MGQSPASGELHGLAEGQVGIGKGQTIRGGCYALFQRIATVTQRYRDAGSAEQALAVVQDQFHQLQPRVGGDIYLVWSRSQANSADHYRIADKDRIQALVVGVAQSPAFEVVRSWPDAVVFRWRSTP